MSRGLDLILASESARRRSILKQIGFEFRVEPPEFEERLSSTLPPRLQAEKLACGKCEAVRETYPDSTILAADTIVFKNGRQLGKPSDRDEAEAMLRMLKGGVHFVITGLALHHPSLEKLLVASETTSVEFRDFGEEEIRWYMDTGECDDKAGSYGIQGFGATLVKRIEGCYYNVVGLPVPLFLTMLTNLKRQIIVP